ncbi:DUF6234 family protein [Streptomyces sp. NPDC001514]
MTTTTPQPTDGTTDSTGGGSGFAAFGLVLLEVLAVLGVLAALFAASFHLDTGSPAPEVRLDGYLGAVGVVFLFAAGAALVGARRKAWVIVWSQVVMAVLLLAGIIGVGALQRHEDAWKDPAPRFTGMVGCRSGGDNSECPNTGG